MVEDDDLGAGQRSVNVGGVDGEARDAAEVPPPRLARPVVADVQPLDVEVRLGGVGRVEGGREEAAVAHAALRVLAERRGELQEGMRQQRARGRHDAHGAGLLTDEEAPVARKGHRHGRGEAAHAAAQPWNGRNALDAAVLGYMNIAALRQHIRPQERIHGVFTNGGDKPNIVPATAAMHWFVRAADIASLEALKTRVLSALQAGGDATCCSTDFSWIEPSYAELVRNDPFEELYASNSAAIGRVVSEPSGDLNVVGSTDMGNVSHIVPSIHPMISVAPRGIGIHTEKFTDYAASASGDAGVLDGAKAMAMTIIDLWSSPEKLKSITAAFDSRLK